MAIAGFAVMNANESAKSYKRLKKKCLPKGFRTQEIKSIDRLSERFIIPGILSPEHKIKDISMAVVTQQKSTLHHAYFKKGKLHYDRLYLDLAKALLLRGWRYIDKDIVIVTFDSYITKSINKAEFSGSLQTELKFQNPDVNFTVRFGTSEIENLQLADQICGIVHKNHSIKKAYYRRLKQVYEVREIIDPLSFYLENKQVQKKKR